MKINTDHTRLLLLAVAVLTVLVAVQSYQLWEMRKELQHSSRRSRQLRTVRRDPISTFFNSWPMGDTFDSLMATPWPSPKIDEGAPQLSMRHEGNELVIELELPDGAKDGIKLETRGNTLHVAVEYGKAPYQRGKFEQSLTLPSNVDIAGMKTKTTDKGLEIIFPRIGRS